MKILITGGTGLVGHYLSRMFEQKEDDVIVLSHKNCDINDFYSVKGLFYETEPDIVFHLAAFTNVDGSEQNPIIAFKTNVGGTNNIAIMAERLNSYIVYISTDFVFDGRKKFPYTEDDIAFPVSVYGKTKLEGEQIIKDVCKQYCIVRTSKVFGKNGRNFASVLPEKLKRKEKIAITTDLVNSPTYAKDLAVALCKIVEKRFNGLLNFCNKGWCNWYEFGMYICRYYNFDTSLLIPISVNNFHDSIAPRPCFSALDTSLFARNFFQPRPWQLALEEFLKTEFFV